MRLEDYSCQSTSQSSPDADWNAMETVDKQPDYATPDFKQLLTQKLLDEELMVGPDGSIKDRIIQLQTMKAQGPVLNFLHFCGAKEASGSCAGSSGHAGDSRTSLQRTAAGFD